MDSHARNFSSYEIKDFVNDKGFVTWVQSPTSEQDSFWEQVRQEYPEKIYQMQEARRLVQRLSFKADKMEPDEQQKLWDIITEETGIKQKQKGPGWLQMAGVAAAVVLLVAFAFFFYGNRKAAFHTGYGEMATLVLPDSSVVSLNANSKISYAKDWEKDETREVWLEGEAFFEVNHLHRKGSVKPGERFVVHTGKMDIEVLGTSFNVQKRRGNIKVALTTGKVSLDVKGVKRNLIMKPGDVVEYGSVRNSLSRRVEDVERFSAWREGQLVFNDTPLGEVLVYIEDTYGYQVELKDKALARKRLSGSFRSREEEVLFQALSKALGISITTDKKTNKLIIQE